MTNLKAEADRIAARYDYLAKQLYPTKDRMVSWDRLRDVVDLDTGQDLDCIALDILTDMVEKRLKARAA